jgi:hypothetical protein
MTTQHAEQSREAKAFCCTRCTGSMRVARIDPFPMPRGSIEILNLECTACGSTLQQVQARTDQD